VIFKSYAKINLALDVLGRDKNDYHFIQTILQKIPLYDSILIERHTKNSIIFKGEESHLINPKKNIVATAIKKLKLSNKYKIFITKNIPIGAGLGGGSSNVATILKAINDIENLGFSNNKLRKICSKIGTDIPFFIESDTAFAEHYGEIITTLPSLKLENFYKILIIPKERKSTALMYKRLDLSLCGKEKNKTDKMLQAIKSKNPTQVLHLMHNDFEKIPNQTLENIKEKIPKYSILCGSGTAIFAISNNPFDLKALSQELPNLHILGLPQLEDHAQFSL